MATHYTKGEILSRAESQSFVEESTFNYFREYLQERLADYESPESIMKTGINSTDEYGAEDVAVTEDGVTPEFKESQLADNSLDRKLKSKKEVYGLITKAIEYMDFAKAHAGLSVHVLMGQNNPVKFNHDMQRHLFVDNKLVFKTKTPDDDQRFEGKPVRRPISELTKAAFQANIKQIKIKAPEDKELLSHLEGLLKIAPVRSAEPNAGLSL